MTFYLTTSPYRMVRRWAAPSAEENMTLPVNIYDDGDVYQLTAYVPGLKAENLNIQVLEEAVSIEGEYGQHEGEALMNELPAGAFRRSLRFPVELDAEKAEATIDNGVLTLRIPKAESARPKIIKVASK